MAHSPPVLSRYLWGCISSYEGRRRIVSCPEFRRIETELPVLTSVMALLTWICDCSTPSSTRCGPLVEGTVLFSALPIPGTALPWMCIWILVFHDSQSRPLVKIRATGIEEVKAGVISNLAVGNNDWECPRVSMGLFNFQHGCVNGYSCISSCLFTAACTCIYIVVWFWVCE